MKLAIFAYNFPHKKTQDFILKLFFEGFKIDIVLAANPIKLNFSSSKLRTKLRYINLTHPRIICDKLGIPYKVVKHNSDKTVQILRKNKIDVGLIAGARIIKLPVIKAVDKGIINFHPGLIPQVRGLNALERSILNDVPLGVTAHFIDERIDAGRIIEKQKIPIYKDDSLIDLSHRLYETQMIMLPKVLKLIKNKKLTDFLLVKRGEGNYYPPLTLKEAKLVKQKFKNYMNKFAQNK